MILLYCDDIDRRASVHKHCRDNGILIDAAPLGEFCSRSFSPDVEALLIVGPTPPGFLAFLNLRLPIISVGRYQIGDSIHFRSEFDNEFIDFLRNYACGDPRFDYNNVLVCNGQSILYLGYPLSLTQTERAVLYFLIKQKDRSVSTEEIIEVCLGDAYLKSNTVSKHISSINRKASLIGGRRLIFSPQNGYYKIKRYI